MDYYEQLLAIADEEGYDGCTMAGSAQRECCAEHDYHYRNHQRLDGTPITKAEADARFLRCMQRRGLLGWWSPLAWGRYAAVRWMGRKAWESGGRG